MLRQVLAKEGVTDPHRFVAELKTLGFEIKHDMFLQVAQALEFDSVVDFWKHHAKVGTTFDELERITGFSRSTLQRSKRSSLGLINSNIAAQVEIWGHSSLEEP